MDIETIIIPTIQHTGTWYLMGLIERLGLSVSLWEQNRETEARQVHFSKEFIDPKNYPYPNLDVNYITTEELRSYLLKGHRVVVPLRHPVRSFQTTIKRGQLDNDFIAHSYNALCDLWEEFKFPIFLVGDYDYEFRIKQLQRMCNDLKLYLNHEAINYVKEDKARNRTIEHYW